MKYLYILLIFIPVTLAGKFMGFSDPMLFLCSSLAIIPLAGVMGKSTDDIACFCGQKIGGLLNATFGNATELIIAFVAIDRWSPLRLCCKRSMLRVNFEASV